MGYSKHAYASNSVAPKQKKCPTGKVGYSSKSVAKRTLKQMGGGRSNYRTYRCDHCEFIHITSQSYATQVANGYYEGTENDQV